MDGLDRAENGDIILSPVVGWVPFFAYGMACGLRIETVSGNEHLARVERNECKPDAVQIVLTAEQAEELVAVLKKQVEVVRRTPDGISH